MNKLLTMQEHHGEVLTVELSLDDLPDDLLESAADLDEEVKEYQRKHNLPTYADALARLAKEPAFLARWRVLYPSSSNHHERNRSMDNLGRLYWQVQRMDLDELESFGKSHGVDMTQEFDDEFQCRAFVCEQLNLEKPEGDEPDVEEESAGSKLDKLARAYQRKHPGLSYETCLGKMREQNKELARRYAESFPSGVSARKA